MIALDFPFVKDAMLALAALHTFRQNSRYWSALEGRMVYLQVGDDGHGSTRFALQAAIHDGWRAASESRKAAAGQPGPGSVTISAASEPIDMLALSRKHFARALEGHQQAVAQLDETTCRPCYLCSLLISYYSLFTLNESPEESLMLDPQEWFRLSRGPFFIIEQWRRLAGDSWFIQAGAMFGEPDLSNDRELFDKKHQKGFEYLLAPVEGDEVTDEDRSAYEDTLSYFGLIYKGIVHRVDSPRAIGRRVIAMPARVPVRFSELLAAYEPRASAILAHVFASMHLAASIYPWFQGIAQRQVPIICHSLPPNWRPMVHWPMQVVNQGRSNMPS